MTGEARLMYVAQMKQRVEEAQKSGEVRTCIHITPDKYTVEMPHLMIRTSTYLLTITMFMCLDCFQKATCALRDILSGKAIGEARSGD